MRNLSPPEFSNFPSCHSAQSPLSTEAPRACVGGVGVGVQGVVAMSLED